MRFYALTLATSISILTHNTNSSETSSSATIHTNTTATGGPPDRRHDGVPASRPQRAQENTIGEERQPKSLETVVDFAASALSNMVHRTGAPSRVISKDTRALRKAMAEWATYKPPIAANHNGARNNRRTTTLLAHTADINHANDKTSSAVESVGARQAEIEKLREIANRMDINEHEELSAGALHAEVERLREIANMMDVNGHEEISAVALEAEVEKLREIASLHDDWLEEISAGALQGKVEKLQEIANVMDVNEHEEISAVALEAEVEKLREIASLHDDGHEEISAVALQAKEEKRQEIASLHDDGHDEISDAISQVVKDATFYAATPVRGRSKIPFGSLDLAILERDIKRLSPNPNSPHLLLKALTSYFKGDVAKLESFFADVSCNPSNRAVIRRMRGHVYQDWIAKTTTIKEAASLLKISLQEKDLLASENYDTWLRYIAARAKNCYDRPEVSDLILSELTDLIGKRETAIVFANGRSKNVEVFKVLESKMFAQWKTGGYSPDSFGWDIKQAEKAGYTSGVSDRAIRGRYVKYYNLHH